MRSFISGLAFLIAGLLPLSALAQSPFDAGGGVSSAESSCLLRGGTACVMKGSVQLITGTAAAPALISGQAVNDGFLFPAAGKIAVTFAGVQYGLIDSTLDNFGFGVQALGAITTGTDNIGLGFHVNRSVTTGSSNTGFNNDVFRSLTTGSRNFAAITSAAFAMTTGSDNFTVGNNAGGSITTASAQVILGLNAGASMTTNVGPTDTYANVFIGNQSGRWLGSAGTNGGNACVGANTCGQQAGAVTGVTAYRSTALGAGALLNVTQGTENTAVGHETLKLLTTGGSNAALGRGSGANMIDGGFGTFVGHAAGNSFGHGDSNTFIGNEAGGNPVNTPGALTGTQNVGIGEGSGPIGSINATIAIGEFVTVKVSNTTAIGLGQTAAYVSGDFVNGSTPATISNASGVTWTAAQMRGRQLTRSGAVVASDTTDTAANIVAAIPGCEAGSTIEFDLINNDTGLLTLLAGSGVTLTGTTTVATLFTRRYRARVTNAALGSEAVTIYGVSTAAN